MIYINIAVFISLILLIVYLFFLNLKIHKITNEIKEMLQKPEKNVQIRNIYTNQTLERLLKQINDIFQVKQQERILYQRKEKQMRREIENISHDLRTPLTSIIGYAELIQDPNTKESEQKEYIQIIQKRARVLQGFIQDFHELSRIAGENYPFEVEAIQVQTMLSEVIVAYYQEFEKKNIHVEVELEEKLSSIIVDKIQFNRILNNLIQNALKFSQSTFILKQYNVDGTCFIQFKNDRYQVEEEDIKYMFERFYSGNLSRSNKSSGLGLTISKLLTEKMKGSIEARLEGEIFLVELRFKVS